MANRGVMGIKVTGNVEKRLVDISVYGELTEANLWSIKREIYRLMDHYDTFNMDLSDLSIVDDEGYKFISNLRMCFFFNGKTVHFLNMSNSLKTYNDKCGGKQHPSAI